MAITGTITIEKQKQQITLELQARKTIDGNIMIFDHADMDIVIMTGKDKKVVAFPKSTLTEEVYRSQSRLFDYLFRFGLVNKSYIRGGNVHGALEAPLLESTEVDTSNIDLAIYNIDGFLKQEKPYEDFMSDYEDLVNDDYTDPTDLDSTDLGEVPQAAEKGSIRPGYNYSPYWMSYMLENKKNEKKE
jgi:hypothetical protein